MSSDMSSEPARPTQAAIEPEAFDLGSLAAPGAAWRPVSPALARLRRLLLVTTDLPVALIIALVLFIVGWTVAGLLLLIASVIVAGWGWLAIGRNVRAWGYVERDHDLLIRGGVLFRRLVVVPYGRMQFVDVTSGPLERRYGIATVRLHTAAATTDAHLPGLVAEEAARLRDRLTERGEAQAAGL